MISNHGGNGLFYVALFHFTSKYLKHTWLALHHEVSGLYVREKLFPTKRSIRTKTPNDLFIFSNKEKTIPLYFSKPYVFDRQREGERKRKRLVWKEEKSCANISCLFILFNELL